MCRRLGCVRSCFRAAAMSVPSSCEQLSCDTPSLHALCKQRVPAFHPFVLQYLVVCVPNAFASNLETWFGRIIGSRGGSGGGYGPLSGAGLAPAGSSGGMGGDRRSESSWDSSMYMRRLGQVLDTLQVSSKERNDVGKDRVGTQETKKGKGKTLCMKIGCRRRSRRRGQQPQQY